MLRIRNANFMIYQGLLSSFVEECVMHDIYCFECTRMTMRRQDIADGMRIKKKKKTERIAAKDGSPLMCNGRYRFTHSV